MDPHLIEVPGHPRRFDRRKVLVVIMVPLALALIQVSSVNVALPTIGASLGASDSALQWVLSGYALVFGVTLVPSGRLGDVLGRGTWFVLGLVVFSLASALCGLAQADWQLNAARVVQGVGAGLINPQTMGMIQQYFRGQARARAYALSGMVVSVSVAVGPVLAGTLIWAVGPEFGWRVPFLLNVPLGLLGVLLALRWLPFESERARRAAAGPRERTRLDLDAMGALLLTGAVLCVMLPFIGSGSTAWRWALLPVAGLFGWLWVRWEATYKARGHEPMVDLDLLAVRSFAFGTATSGVFFLGSTSLFTVVALYLQNGLGMDALHAGLMGLPNAACSMVAAMWSGRHALRRGHGIVVGSLVTAAVGVAASIGIAHFHQGYGLSPWWLLATLAVAGIGQGAFGSANQTLAMNEVPVRMAGTAGGVKSTAERVATAIGIACITGVLFSVQPAAGWDVGFAAAYAVVVVVLLTAVLLAVKDKRRAAGAEPIAVRSGDLPDEGLQPIIPD